MLFRAFINFDTGIRWLVYRCETCLLTGLGIMVPWCWEKFEVPMVLRYQCWRLFCFEYSGSEFSEDTFIAKVKMEIVICKEQVITLFTSDCDLNSYTSKRRLHWHTFHDRLVIIFSLLYFSCKCLWHCYNVIAVHSVWVLLVSSCIIIKCFFSTRSKR